MRLTLKLQRVAIWQPRPYIATASDGEPLSYWFYKQLPGTEGLFVYTALGSMWYKFWHTLSEAVWAMRPTTSRR